MKTLLFTSLLLVLAIDPARAQHEDPNGQGIHGTASKEALKVLDDFRTVIINNDRKKAEALLTGDVRILESGGIETKKEYLSHHFNADGKFLGAMEREVKLQKVQTMEHTAWVSTVSQMHGTYNDKELSLNSAELVVLVKTDKGWKISAVHWSSRSTE